MRGERKNWTHSRGACKLWGFLDGFSTREKSVKTHEFEDRHNLGLHLDQGHLAALFRHGPQQRNEDSHSCARHVINAGKDDYQPDEHGIDRARDLTAQEVAVVGVDASNQLQHHAVHRCRERVQSHIEIIAAFFREAGEGREKIHRSLFLQPNRPRM